MGSTLLKILKIEFVTSFPSKNKNKNQEDSLG